MDRNTFWLLEQAQKETVSRKGGEEARIEKEKKDPKNLDNKLEEYHTGGGWYKLPSQEKAIRKDEAIETLKEG